MSGDLRWLLGLLARPGDDGGEVRLRGGPSPRPSGPTYDVLPSIASPRLVVSQGLPASAVGGVMGTGDLQSRVRRAVLQLASTAVGRTLAGATVHVTGSPALLETHLARLLGQAGVGLVVRSGNPERANRKPIVKVVDVAGRPLAFTKVGWNPLTDRLVDHEAAALTAEAPAGGRLQVPQVLAHERWRGLTLLTTSPMGDGSGEALELSDRRHAELLAEIGARGAGTGVQPLAETPWFTDVRARVAQLPSPWRTVVEALAEQVAQEHGDVEVRTGTWHGDWTPWNMQVEASSTHVWDWERSAAGVPLGLDALHHTFQVAMLVEGDDAARARMRAGRRAAAVLAHLDAAPPEVLEAAYVLEIAVRWAEDVGQPGGGVLRRRLRDLLRTEGLTVPGSATRREGVGRP